VAFHAIQTVGIVPPSITYSLPVMEEARSDAKNAVADALVDVAPAGRHSFSVILRNQSKRRVTELDQRSAVTF